MVDRVAVSAFPRRTLEAMSTPMTAAQAAQQNNRDGAGRYAAKAHAEAEVELTPADAGPTPEQAARAALVIEHMQGRNAFFCDDGHEQAARLLGLETNALADFAEGPLNVLQARVEEGFRGAEFDLGDAEGSHTLTIAVRPMAPDSQVYTEEILFSSEELEHPDDLGFSVKIVCHDALEAAGQEHYEVTTSPEQKARDRRVAAVAEDLGQFMDFGFGEGMGRKWGDPGNGKLPHWARPDYQIDGDRMTMQWSDVSGARYHCTIQDGEVTEAERVLPDGTVETSRVAELVHGEDRTPIRARYFGDQEPTIDWVGLKGDTLSRSIPMDRFRYLDDGAGAMAKIIAGLDRNHSLVEAGAPDMATGRKNPLLAVRQSGQGWDYMPSRDAAPSYRRPEVSYRVFTEDDGTPIGRGGDEVIDRARAKLMHGLDIQDRDAAREFADWFDEQTEPLTHPSPQAGQFRMKMSLLSTPAGQIVRDLPEGVGAVDIEPVQVGSRRYWQMKLRYSDSTSAFALAGHRKALAEQSKRITGSAAKISESTYDYEDTSTDSWGDTRTETVEATQLEVLVPASGMGVKHSRTWTKSKAGIDLERAQRRARRLVTYDAIEEPELDRFRSAEDMERITELRNDDED